jgi:hypothetical protein
MAISVVSPQTLWYKPPNQLQTAPLGGLLGSWFLSHMEPFWEPQTALHGGLAWGSWWTSENHHACPSHLRAPLCHLGSSSALMTPFLRFRQPAWGMGVMPGLFDTGLSTTTDAKQRSNFFCDLHGRVHGWRASVAAGFLQHPNVPAFASHKSLCAPGASCIGAGAGASGAWLLDRARAASVLGMGHGEERS